MMQIGLIKYAEIDPNNQYPDADPSDLIEACGYLPSWVANPEFIDCSLKDALDTQYGWGLHEMTGGKLNSDLSYSYPEDPDLQPLLVMVRESDTGTETFIQYQYGIVCFKQNDGSTYFCRMD